MAKLSRLKPGTRPKGDREAITTRVPPSHHSHYQERADALGIPLGSWVALKLAEIEELDVPSFVESDLDRAEAKRLAEIRAEGQGDLLATG